MMCPLIVVVCSRGDERGERQVAMSRVEVEERMNECLLTVETVLRDSSRPVDPPKVTNQGRVFVVRTEKEPLIRAKPSWD